MEKKGEKRKLIIHAMFVLIVVLSLYFIITSSVRLTGYAVLDAAIAKSKLESALSSSALFSQVTDASMCIVINDAESPLSLEAIKSSTGWTVSEMKGFCAGADYEDLVIQFPGYDSFSKLVDDPTPRNIANGATNREFEILPSKYVQLGGNVICDATFKVKYCTATKTMATDEQMIDGDLVCCIDQVTSADRKLLEQHIQEGNFKDEIGILEQPSSGVFGLSMTTSLITLGGIVLVILIVVMIVAGGKKAAPKAKAPAVTPAQLAMPTVQPMPQAENPQITDLRNYVVQALGEGYDPNDIKTHLLDIGWDAATSDKVIGEASQRVA